MSVKVRVKVSRAGVRGMLNGPDIRRELAVRAERVQRMAQQIAPVDTGRYRASIHVRMTTRGGVPVAQIVAATPYAVYLEFGTRRMRAQKVMRRALVAANR